MSRSKGLALSVLVALGAGLLVHRPWEWESASLTDEATRELVALAGELSGAPRERLHEIVQRLFEIDPGVSIEAAGRAVLCATAAMDARERLLVLERLAADAVPTELRAAAIEGLATTDRPESLAPLMVRDPDPRLRARVAERLASAARALPVEWVGYAVEASYDLVPRVRVEACRVLARTSTSALVDRALLDRLDDGSDGVGTAAAGALVRRVASGVMEASVLEVVRGFLERKRRLGDALLAEPGLADILAGPGWREKLGLIR
ncbi:MAG: hypothetical protein AB1486_19100 [Planctomycetota bacterium]